MTNKLYNALIKSQAEQEAQTMQQPEPAARKQEPSVGKQEPSAGKPELSAQKAEPKAKPQLQPELKASTSRQDPVILDEPPLEEAFTATRDSRIEYPFREEAVRADRRPALYNSAVSLGMINNPYPWTIDQLRTRKIIYPSMADKRILNAYRELRIKLRNLSENENFTVMMTSLSRKFGKRDNAVLPAFNLAASFALDAHSSALLVDCDPYRNDLSKLVSVGMTEGVTDFIDNEDINVRDIIYPSGVDRLSVIPAGTLDVSTVELFSSQRMKTLMEELKGRYPDRYIVLNAPPFRLHTEGRILVRYVDHALMMVPFGQLSPEDILESVDALDADKFAGLVYQD